MHRIMVNRQEELGVVHAGFDWPGFGVDAIAIGADFEAVPSHGDDVVQDDLRKVAIELEFILAARTGGAGLLQGMPDVDGDHGA